MILMLPPNLNPQTTGLQDSKAYVLNACRSMLRPIVRMLLKSGVVHRVFLNMTREVYIDVARSEFGLRGRPTSISRIALLTGLARKEVRRITNVIDSGEDSHYEISRQDRIARVLSGWFQDTDYLTKEGQPLPIPVDGPAPSFADLKSRYGGDVPASAILRELLTYGTVVKTDDGLVKPVYRNYAPNPADPEYIMRAGSVVEDIGTTVIHNLYRDDRSQKWFERRAINTCIPEDRLLEFRDMVATEGQKFLEKVDAWLSDHEDKDADETIRLGLGMYLIRKSDKDK